MNAIAHPLYPRFKSQTAWILFVCLLALFIAGATRPMQAQTSSASIPPSYMGMMFNNKPATPAWPLAEPLTYGLFRVWDSVGAQWPEIQTSAGTSSSHFTWTTLESDLANAYSNGDTAAFYTMNRTPNWALNPPANCSGSNATTPACDQRCNYWNTPPGTTTGSGAPGQCYPPSDLNPDGSGTNQTWKNWVTALANEAVKLCSAGGYACIQYYEIWNEIDRNNQGYAFPGSSYAAPYMFGSASPHDYGNSYYGSFAQLVRMTQDARCIILGRSSLKTKGTVNYAIDNAGGVGVAQSCTQVTGIQPSALIVSPSSHPVATEGLNVIQDLLYCTVSGTTTGAPNWCNTGTDEAADLDIMNWHMKPANESDGWNEENEMLTQYCDVVGSGIAECVTTGDAGILSGNELSKPFWNGEAGYRGNSSGWQGTTGAPDLTGIPDMQASFIARYALTQWSIGIDSFSWYEYDLDSVLNGESANGSGTQAGDPALAYSSMFTWLTGNSGQRMTVGGVGTPCSITSGTTTQWTCNFQGNASTNSTFKAMAIWDIGSSYGCASTATKGLPVNGGSVTSGCTYYTYTPASSWHYYRDLWGNETAIPPGGTVLVGNLPIFLENKKLF